MRTLSLTLLAWTALAASSAAAWAQPAPGRAQGESELAPVPAELVAAVKVDERLRDSVPLDATFRDQDGRVTTLGTALEGDLPTLLTFNYSSCPALCSLHLNGLVDALAKSKFEVGAQVRVVTIVLAPDEPTADALRTRDRYLAKLRDLGGKGRSSGWTFLTAVGPDDDRQIHRVADAVGFGYRYIPTQREYAHPAVTIALAPSGKVMRYIHGVAPDPGELDQTIVRAGVGETSTAAGFLAACLHWDAARNSNRWGGRVMKIAALLFLALGGIAVGVLVARNRRGPGVNPS
ncbi:MAG: SCO family protein [Myxococcales bacterium]|nr:SCO family protein [Myxococcales bacterium]MBK7194472.1 SCO family protein [Myxococcales bacterium]MBP6849644.1 SCO family protein [Kofleriaceae bacterium]